MKRIILIFMACLFVLAGCGKSAGQEGASDGDWLSEMRNANVPESKIHIQKQEDCSLKDGGILRLCAMEFEGEQNLFVDVVIPDDERACVIFERLCSFFGEGEIKDWCTNCCVKTNSGSVMYIEEKIIGINSDGTTSSGTPDWFINEADYTMSKEEREDLENEVVDYISAFLAADGS